MGSKQRRSAWSLGMPSPGWRLQTYTVTVEVEGDHLFTQVTSITSQFSRPKPCTLNHVRLHQNPRQSSRGVVLKGVHMSKVAMMSSPANRSFCNSFHLRTSHLFYQHSILELLPLTPWRIQVSLFSSLLSRYFD